MGEDKIRTIQAPRLMIVGTSIGVGVSTLMLGLLVSLKRKGVSVAVGRVGSALIEATHHRRVSGRLCHVFDPWMQTKEQIQDSLGRLASGAELILIEGQGGAYDRWDADTVFGRNAELARALSIPMVLVVDAQGFRESVAALVKGFRDYGAQCGELGLICNRVESSEQVLRMRQEVAQLDGGGVRFLGAVKAADDAELGGKALEVEQANPSLLTRNKLIALGDLVQEGVDITGLSQFAGEAQPLSVKASVLEGRKRLCRIAVADDAAFHLTIQDNLDLIRRSGAEIVAFSPLADLKLPVKSGGLYLPAGYVHLYARDLSINQAMLQAIRDFVDGGGVLFAEGNSLAYLCSSLVLSNGEQYPMTGVVAGLANAVLSEDVLPEPIPCEVTMHEENILGRTGDRVRGLRDTRWLIRLEKRVLNCFQVRDRAALRGNAPGEVPPTLEGLSPEAHVLATTVMTHWGSNPRIARMFVDSVTASVPAMNAVKASAKKKALKKARREDFS